MLDNVTSTMGFPSNGKRDDDDDASQDERAG